MTYSIKKKSSILWKIGLTEDQVYSRIQSVGDKVYDWEVCPIDDTDKTVPLTEFDKLKENIVTQKRNTLTNSALPSIQQKMHVSHPSYNGVKNQTLAKLMLSGIGLSLFSGIILRTSGEALGFGISLYVISIILNLFLTSWAIVRLWNIDSMIGFEVKPKTLSEDSEIGRNLDASVETTEDKLRKSKKLHEEGLLTDEAYAQLNLDLAQKLK
jgi:hypothetical protein